MSGPEMQKAGLSVGKVIGALNDIEKLIGWAINLEAAARRQLQGAAEIRALADKLKAEGRETLNAEEWQSIAGPANAARDKLADALGEKPEA